SKQQKAEDAAEETRRQAELDLLLMDDETLAAEARHFDMNEIIKSEKAKGRRRQRRRGKKGAEDDTAPIQEGFNINVADPRFAAVHESSTFAIDPTNPRFTKTKAMDELLSERRKRQRSTAN
ncbi:pre-rRNA-processing protein esf1, partial [Tieghemiomyces parasiticus]